MKPKTPTPEPLPTDSALIDFEGIVELGRPLGRERTRRLKLTDPRFPKPLFGGAERSRAVYSRAKVVAYFETLANEGPAVPA